MNEGLTEMFQYNAWANQVLFESCRPLTYEQLDHHVLHISGTIRELLMHIVGAQQTFILRTKGRQHEGELTRKSPWPGIDKLIEMVEITSEELIAIAQNLIDDEEVALPYQGSSYLYPKRFFLVHALEHGVEHRTELKVALAHMGIETPDLDGWFYSEAAGYGQVV